MATSVHDVFEAFRRAPSNYERGAKFEKLMAQYLLLDPVYGRLFDQVWLWKEWPGRAGKVDTGIDLVAQEAAELTAHAQRLREQSRVADAEAAERGAAALLNIE